MRLFARAYRAGGGTRFPGGVRPVDVREYLATLRAAGTAPATLQRRCGGLVIFFRWAQATALVRSTPMVDIAVPAIDPPTRVALRSSELRRLLRSVHQHGSVRDVAICEMLAATGLRVDELARLELKQLELSERRGVVHVVGKGYRKRDIPLHPDIRRTLREWLAARPATVSPLLFPGRSGPLDRTTIERLLAKYARFAGDLPHVTPHVLRHYAVPELMPPAGVDRALAWVIDACDAA